MPRQRAIEYLIRVRFQDGEERYYADLDVRDFRGVDFTKHRTATARYAKKDAALYVAYTLKERYRRIVDFEVEEQQLGQVLR